MPLIIKADMIDPSWEDWGIEQCPCGNEYCTSWRLNTARGEGYMSHDDARLANAAPKLVMALVRISVVFGGMNNLDPQAVEALQAALGKDNVFIHER